MEIFLVEKNKQWPTDKDQRKERNVLFNNAINTFYLQLYGIRHMEIENLYSKRGHTLLPLHELLFLITRDILHAPSHRQDSTYHNSLCYTSCGALAGTIAVWVHNAGSIQ